MNRSLLVRGGQILLKLLPLLIVAAAWEMAAQAKLLPAYLFPSVSSIAARFAILIQGDLLVESARTLGRVATGWGCAIVIGLSVGLLMARVVTAKALIDPLLKSLYPMPKTALIPIIILWLGLGNAANIALIFIGCMLPIVVATYNAAREVDHHLVWSARFLGASEIRIVRTVVIPASMPQVLNGIRTALALGFVLVMSAELVMAQNGLGHLIYLTGENGDYAGMFAGIAMIAIMGFVADWLFQLVMQRLVFWAEETDAI